MQEIFPVVLVAALVVLSVILYYQTMLNQQAMAGAGGAGAGAVAGGAPATPIEVNRRVMEVDLSQDNGRRMMHINRVNPAIPDAEIERDYPNLQLPFQVIGGGRRMIPTYGGSQIPIANPTLPVNVSGANIAPVNIYQPDMTDSFRQVGVIMKVFGENNQMLPLFGREKWPNSNKWLYYTKVGDFGVSLPVKSAQHSGYDFQLQDNDEVVIKGVGGKYRVTTYDTDNTDYIPVRI